MLMIEQINKIDYQSQSKSQFKICMWHIYGLVDIDSGYKIFQGGGGKNGCLVNMLWPSPGPIMK